MESGGRAWCFSLFPLNQQQYQCARLVRLRQPLPIETPVHGPLSRIASEARPHVRIHRVAYVQCPLGNIHNTVLLVRVYSFAQAIYLA